MPKLISVIKPQKPISCLATKGSMYSKRQYWLRGYSLAQPPYQGITFPSTSGLNYLRVIAILV